MNTKFNCKLRCLTCNTILAEWSEPISRTEWQDGCDRCKNEHYPTKFDSVHTTSEAIGVMKRQGG